MASRKEYLYQIKGKKLSLIERDSISSDGLNYTFSGVSGDGVMDGTSSGSTAWKSPITSVADGLEVEYVYSPQYSVSSNAAVDYNKFYVNGWTIINGYLAFLRARRSTISNWSSSPESTVTSGTAGDTGGQTRDYIVVGGSSRWNGLHRVQTAGTEGQLVTYTKVHESLPYWEDQNVDFNTDEEIFGRSGGSLYLADYFSTSDYVFISGSNDEANNGLFSISALSASSTVNSSKLTLGTRYAVVNSSDATSYSTGLDNEYSAAAALAAETSQSDINIYKAHRDFCYVLTDVNVLNDENDEIDLPSYLNKALILYLKAKIAEDAMNIEMKEYLMKEFRKMVEKHESGKIWGSRQILSGPNAIR